MRKNVITMVFIMALAMMLAGCGKSADVEPIVEDVVGTAVAEELEDSEEESEVSYYTGGTHYIDPEEASRTALEEANDESEEEQSKVEDETATEAEETKVEGEVKATPEPEPEPETVVQPTAEPEPVVPTPEPTVDYYATFPEIALSDGEWYPPLHAYAIVDVIEIRDEPSADSPVQGTLPYGTGFGTFARSGDYIQISYGAKPAWVAVSDISYEDPLK